MSTPWYVKAFGDHYEDLYAHRNDADAARALDFLVEHRLGPEHQNGRVLDLCCGAGRHSIGWIQAGGSDIVGIDLADNLLDTANAESREKDLTLHLTRGDMARLPFQDQSFGLVLNLFTSFGYFTDETQNQRVLDEVARVLRPGGQLVLDHMNPEYLKANLVSESTRVTPSGIEMHELRRIIDDASRVEKTIRFDDADGNPVEVVESVRFYQPEEMTDMAARAGLRVSAVYGDFDSRPPGGDAPRAIYIMERQ